MARLPCMVISKIIGDKVHPYIFYKRSHVINFPIKLELNASDYSVTCVFLILSFT